MELDCFSHAHVHALCFWEKQKCLNSLQRSSHHKHEWWAVQVKLEPGRGRKAEDNSTGTGASCTFVIFYLFNVNSDSLYTWVTLQNRASKVSHELPTPTTDIGRESWNMVWKRLKTSCSVSYSLKSCREIKYCKKSYLKAWDICHVWSWTERKRSLLLQSGHNFIKQWKGSDEFSQTSKCSLQLQHRIVWQQITDPAVGVWAEESHYVRLLCASKI